jgi:hypothetical protein
VGYRIGCSRPETCGHYFAAKPREGVCVEFARKIGFAGPGSAIATRRRGMRGGEAGLSEALCTGASAVPIVPRMRYVSARAGRDGDEA